MSDRFLWLRSATLFGRSIVALANDRSQKDCPLVFAQFDLDGHLLSASPPLSVGMPVNYCSIAALGRGRGVAMIGQLAHAPSTTGKSQQSQTLAHWLSFRVAKGSFTFSPIEKPSPILLRRGLKTVVDGERVVWVGCTGTCSGVWDDQRLTLAVSRLGKSVTTNISSLESNDVSSPVIDNGRVILLNSAGYHRLELIDATDPSAPKVIAEITAVKRAKPPRRQNHQLASPHVVVVAGRLRLIWGEYLDQSKGKPWAGSIKSCEFDLNTESLGAIETLAEDSHVVLASLQVVATKDGITATWENRKKGPSSGVQYATSFRLDDPLPIQPVSMGKAATGHLLNNRAPIYLSDQFYEPSGSCRIPLFPANKS